MFLTQFSPALFQESEASSLMEANLSRQFVQHIVTANSLSIQILENIIDS